MIPKRTYLTINDDRIIIYVKREPGEICFNEVKTFITIKQQELCDILNERLNSYKRNEKKYPTR